MPEDILSRSLPVPSGRIARLARFGGLASGLAGSAALGGARALARGERPELAGLLLTPGNAARLAEELARMRGAAMKLGQLMSMDAGEMLPPDFAAVLARLRAEAHHMPPRQLRDVLDANWGTGWRRRFRRFDVRPMAAASIGQVHRAVTADGRDLAIKVQYPGVRRAIESDVRNVAALIRMSGLVPKTLDLAPLLDEATRQLREEADYEREGDALQRFARLLAGAEGIRVPALQAELTTRDVLAMSHEAGEPVEAQTARPRAERDRIATRLAALTLQELFGFGWMQTDPNFANYRYRPETGELVLLDFGAVREVPEWLSDAYRRLMCAGLVGDRAGVAAAAEAIGVFGPQTEAHHRAALLEMLELAFVPLRRGGAFDFGDGALGRELRDRGMALGQDRNFWHVPPADTLFVQRKLGGMYLLAARLKARVDLAALVAPWR